MAWDRMGEYRMVDMVIMAPQSFFLLFLSQSIIAN